MKKSMIFVIIYAFFILVALVLLIYSVAAHHLLTVKGDIILKQGDFITGHLTFTYLLFVKTAKLTMEIDDVPDTDPTKYNFQELCEVGDEYGEKSNYCRLKRAGHAFEVITWLSIILLLLLITLTIKFQSGPLTGISCIILGFGLMNGYWIVYYLLKEHNCALRNTIKKKAGDEVTQMLNERQLCWNRINRSQDNGTRVKMEISVVMWLCAGCILLFISLVSYYCEYAVRETTSPSENPEYSEEQDQNAIDLMDITNEEERKENARNEAVRQDYAARASQMDFEQMN